MATKVKCAICLGVALAAGCGPRPPASAYLHTSTDGTARDQARDMDVDNLAHGSSSLRLGNSRLEPKVCDGVATSPAYAQLGPGDLADFLREQGYSFEIETARGDLKYFDVQLPGGESMRLRVAVLGSAAEAARDLHEALLEHGRGSWGVHRSNLAVLAPIGSGQQIVELAAKTKLACWGVLTVAGRDDVFVIPGGYAEL